jgi:hypothetical protein
MADKTTKIGGETSLGPSYLNKQINKWKNLAKDQEKKKRKDWSLWGAGI